MSSMLEVKNLSVAYPGFTLHELSFNLEEGEIMAVVGESGSGKTTLLKAVSCLSDEDARVSGEILLHGSNIVSMPEASLRAMRWTEFSVAFQNSAQWLNPSLTLKAQLEEILKRKPELYKDRHTYMPELMETVGLTADDLPRRPSELSGGMAQKFLLACAIALKPALVLLDEPTSALDAHARDNFSALIKKLNQEHRMAFLIITHDVKLASMLSKKVAVLYNGHLEEMGDTDKVLKNPMHPYTKGLITASVAMNPFKDVWGIRAGVPHERHGHGCPFAGRCTQAIEACFEHSPELTPKPDGRVLACLRGGIVTAMECRGVSKSYGKQNVLKNVDFYVRCGEVAAIVGKSGAGKTTLASIIGGYTDKIDSGELFFMGETADYDRLHRIESGIQMVFQDSEASLNPNMTVAAAVCEPRFLSKLPEQKENAVKALNDVGLPCDDDFLARKIKTLSGGQKQRVSIARALTMNPQVLIADEPTAMLDPSGTANLLRLLKGLQNSRGMSMVIVTHDLESAVKIADRCYLVKDASLAETDLTDYFTSTINDLMI